MVKRKPAKRGGKGALPATQENTAVANESKDPLVKELNGMKGEINKALQGAMPPERFIRIALNEYRLKPAIRNTSRESRLLAVLQAAQAGLEIGGAFGECGLTPYGTECKLSIYYPGLIKAATNAGRISQPSAIPVYENEPYTFDKEMGCNVPTVQLPPKERGKEKVAVYAQMFFDGRLRGEWVWAQDVEAIRSCSQSYRAFKAGKIKSTPWVGDFEDEMWKLAALRRLLKRTPKSAIDFRLMAAIEANNADFDFPSTASPQAPTAPRTIHGGSLRNAIGVDGKAKTVDAPAEAETPAEAEAPAEPPPPEDPGEAAPDEPFVPLCNECKKPLTETEMFHGECKNEGCRLYGVKVKL